MTTDANWYYVLAGAQVGPVSLQAIENMARTGSITPETRVWNGEGDWRAARLTELAGFFVKPERALPPPLSGVDVDNRFVWAVVAVPVVGAIAELIVGMTMIWLYILANVACCVLDERKLKAAGHKTPVNWMVFIVPVYLWKRAELLAQKKHYFWGWIGAFVVSLLISLGGGQAALEDAACSTLSDMLGKHYQYRGVSCVAVSIDDEVRRGFYRATAILDNGNELNITIHEKGDKILVQVPAQ